MIFNCVLKFFLVRLLNYVSFNILTTLVGIFSGPQDLILAPSPPLTVGLSALIIALSKRIPYIYNVQDINPDVLIKLGILKNPIGIFLSRWLEQIVYRGAKHITVLSDGFRENLMKKGVSPEKISVISNFIDADFVHPLPRENQFRDRYNLRDKFLVIYAGNLGHSQNLEDLLIAAKMMQSKGVDIVQFVIVGNGSRECILKTASKTLNLQNVLFVPFQPRELVPSIFAAADISFITLKMGIALNSMPSKLYTIMASCRPVIAAVDIGSDIWKLVKEAFCGINVPPETPQAIYEAILHLYRHPELCATFGDNGRHYVARHFTREIIGEKYHSLFEHIIANP